MTDFVKRMIEEYDSLQEKYNKLLAFMKTENFNKLDKVNFELLIQQQRIMYKYLDVLKKRIDLNYGN